MQVMGVATFSGVVWGVTYEQNLEAGAGPASQKK